MRIEFTNIRRSITVPLSPDIRAIYIKTIEVESLDEKIKLNSKEISDNLRIRWEFMNIDDHIEKDSISMDVACINNKSFIINSLIGDVDIPRKSLTFELDTKIAINFNIIIELEIVDLLPIVSPEESFSHHLQEDFNSKILFSAPYGQGKTTFLNNYFSKYKNAYQVFHLFPVNYSISNNKDIFEYIKCAILLELLRQPNLEFDKQEFTYLQTLPDFIKKNGYNLFKPFLKLIPSVGGAMFSITENLEKVSEKYFENHNEVQIDDKKVALNYVQRFYEESGSLYEDDFITQLIRQLLKQLKQTSGQENILIIDDLDRMDPEHIFRILNVFAAHFDGEEILQLTNKFGFDRIILVCDYNNLHKIFAHKYGVATDFAGYIDKFYSKGIYYYDNTSESALLIEQVPINQNLKQVLRDMHTLGQLSLRELLKLKYVDLSKIALKISKSVYSTHDFPHLIFLLKSIFDIDTVVSKLKYCKNARIEQVKESIYDELAKDVLAQYLVEKSDSNYISNMEYKYTLNSKELRFTVTNTVDNRHHISKIIDRSRGAQSEYDKSLTYYDFYSILIDWISTSPIWIGGDN